MLFTCPLQDGQAGISGPLSLNFLCERLTWEPVLALCNSIATCSLLLTPVNLVLRSAAARKRFLLALCDAQIFALGYENRPNLWQSQSISSRICCSHSPGAAGEAPSYLTFCCCCCSPPAPLALSSLPKGAFCDPCKLQP